MTVFRGYSPLKCFVQFLIWTIFSDMIISERSLEDISLYTGSHHSHIPQVITKGSRLSHFMKCKNVIYKTSQCMIFLLCSFSPVCMNCRLYNFIPRAAQAAYKKHLWLGIIIQHSDPCTIQQCRQEEQSLIYNFVEWLGFCQKKQQQGTWCNYTPKILMLWGINHHDQVELIAGQLSFPRVLGKLEPYVM